MIFLDTTVLVYAVGSTHPYQTPARRLLTAITHGVVRASTTIEVVQEFAHVRARRHRRAEARQLAENYASLLAPLAHTTDEDLRRGLQIWQQHERLGVFDAVLIAAAGAAGAQAVVSSDRGFADVPGIRHVLPDEAGITALLG